jgi:hypothetical protein
MKLSNVVYWSIIAFLISPTQLITELSLVKLEQPESVYYDLWISNLSIFDFFLPIIYLCIAKSESFTHSKSIFMLVILFMFLTLIGLVLQYVNGFSMSAYIDGLIYSLRWIFMLLISDGLVRIAGVDKAIKVIYYSTIILSFVSFLAFFVIGYESHFESRFNFMGVGVNGTAEIILYALVLKIFLMEKPHHNNKVVYTMIAVVSLCFMLYLTGGRRALLLLILIGVLFFFSNKSGLNLTSKVISIILFLSVSILMIDEILASLFSNENFMYFTSAFNISQLNQDGRFAMYLGVFSLLEKYPLGIGLSDWAIQSELNNFTVGSHSHNFIIQSYLKYGPSILILFPIVMSTVLKLNRNLVMLWFIFLFHQMTGYGFWNQKYMFVIALVLAITFNYSHHRRF